MRESETCDISVALLFQYSVNSVDALDMACVGNNSTVGNYRYSLCLGAHRDIYT